MNWLEKVKELKIKRDKLGLNNNQISLLTGIDRSSLGRFFNADNEPRLGLYLLVNNFLLSYKDVSDIDVKDAVIEKPVIELLGVPKKKFGQEENDVIGVSKLASVCSEKKSNPADVKISETAILKKEVDMDFLRDIAAGKGLKSSNSFIPEKVPLEEKYEFEENVAIPDAEYRVAIGTKGIAFTDMYNTSFIYLRFAHRTLMFSDRKEFDRFVKEENVLL